MYIFLYIYTCIYFYIYIHVYIYIASFSLKDAIKISHLIWGGYDLLYVSFAKYSLCYRALLQKRPVILSSMLFVATLHESCGSCNDSFICVTNHSYESWVYCCWEGWRNRYESRLIHTSPGAHVKTKVSFIGLFCKRDL